METITLHYQSTDEFAKKIVEAILASGSFSIELQPPKSELQKSMEEAHDGQYFIAKDGKDAIAKCLV